MVATIGKMSQKSSELKAWMGDNSNMKLKISNTLKVFIFFVVANVFFGSQAMAINIIVEEVDLTTDELGSTGNVNVRFDGTFDEDVLVYFTISDNTEAEFTSGNYLIFGGSNTFTDNLTMSVTGISDNILDDDTNFTLSYYTYSANFSANFLQSGSYSGSNIFTNSDNDMVGITIGSLSGNLSGNVSESGNLATFDVQLDAGTFAGDNVTVYFSSSNTAEVDFYNGINYVDLIGITSGTITLEGVADSGNVIDGEQISLIEVSLVSSNEASGNYTYSTVTGNIHGAGNAFSVINEDMNEAGITLFNQSGNLSGNVSESGNFAMFSVVLDSVPISSENVTVYFTSTDVTEVDFVGSDNVVELSGLVADNIHLYGVSDNIADDDMTEWIYISSVVSANAHYDDLATTSGVNVTNFNIDAGIQLSLISGDVNETGAGNTATFSVNLTTVLAGADTVTIEFASSNTQELTISSNSTLVTNGANLETVTVAGNIDNIIDGDQSVYIYVSDNLVSGNASYSGLDVSGNTVDVNVIDIDVAGITFSAISGNTTESGGSANFTIRLDTIPTTTGPVSVNVGLSIDDGDEFEFQDSSSDTITLTLSGLTEQLVTIVGLDDNVVDGSAVGVISITSQVSGDPNYNGFTFSDNLNIENEDQGESVGITLTPVSNFPGVTEGTTEEFVFSLTSEPTQTVTITPNSTDSDISFNPTSITFAADSSYSTNQEISYTIADDGVVESLTSITVTFAVSSTDGAYDDFLNGTSKFVQVTDDDSVGINFGAFSSNVREDGETATALVSLTSQPTGTGNVVLNLTSGNTAELTSNTELLVFTASNWDNGQIVEVVGISDNIADGDQTVLVTASVNTTLSTSTDGTYNTASLSANASIDVIDIDSPRIILSQVESSIVEETGITSLRVYLNSSPGAGNTVTVSLSANTSDLVLDPESVEFDSTNYNAFKSVSVSSNTDVSPNIVVTVTGNVSGNYNAADASVDYTILDTATAQFVVEADDYQTSENEDTAEFTVALLALPSTDVTVDIDTSDVNEVTISPTSLDFTTSNYTTPQTVTLTGVDDSDIDGLQSYTITLTGGNGNYNGITRTLSFTNVDNDSASVQVQYDELKVTEWGSMQMVTLTLGSTPDSSVDVAISVSDNTEASLSATSLTFDSSNGYETSFIVTGLDDDEEDGNQFFRVDFEQMSSANTDYNGLVVPDLTFFNLDNELFNILVQVEGETSYSNLEDVVLTVQELDGGESYQNFTLKLLTTPAGNVVINLGTSDNTEGTISPSQIVLDSLTASDNITLTGLNDEEPDDIISFNVTLDIDDSTTDPNFSSVPQLTIAANNESFDFRIVDNPDLDETGGEKIFDWLTQSDNVLVLTATQGFSTFSNPFDWTYSLDSVGSSSLTFVDSTNTQANLIIGPFTSSYSFTVVDGRDTSDNTTTYNLYVQGDPLILKYERPTPTSLKIFFEDLVSTSYTRYYDIYYSEIVDPPVWTKINSTKLTGSIVTSKPIESYSMVNGKPTSISSMSVTVDYDGSEEGYFQLKASDSEAEGSGNTTPDISDDILTDEDLQVKYSVIEADDQSVTNPLDQGGGGCLLR
jgi:hypothetical protein